MFSLSLAFSSRSEQFTFSVSCSQKAVLSHERTKAMGLQSWKLQNHESQKIVSVFMSCLGLFPYSDGELTNTPDMGLLWSEGSITKGASCTFSGAFTKSSLILCCCGKVSDARQFTKERGLFGVKVLESGMPKSLVPTSATFLLRILGCSNSQQRVGKQVGAS